MFILASNSPRRQEILADFINFKVITSNLEENNIYYSSPEQLVMALSFEKGIDVAKSNPKDIVLSADTVVTFDNRIFGKPKNREEAFSMIKSLSGKKHKVLTGYSIFRIDENIKYTSYESSDVFFKELSHEQINSYLDTFEYEGKAGAYAIQGYGALIVDHIEGDFFNIVGFPISKIENDLNKLFDISLLRGNKNV